jgi:Protein kinase domain
MTNPHPERIGRYRVVELIGRGGMGSVYKAHDPFLDRMVAIKVMTEGAEVGTEAHERFLREARSAARLNHPNITTVYELGQDQGLAFIAMELLEGEPLSRVIGLVPPLTMPRKVSIMAQICEGLGFAHQRGVIHRDIKPANIFVMASGPVKILDFGIARLASSELTRTGLLMGTPNYMSPEQARGGRSDVRSDIFSVGVVFYELLSGRKPFVGENHFQTMEKVRTEDPPPLDETVPGMPSGLARAVHRALEKDPTARYQTLEELRSDLLAIPDLTPPGGGPEAMRDAVDRRFAEVLRLHRLLVAALGSAAFGEETLRLGDIQNHPGAGLETVLHDLESQTERLRKLARTVERLEPNVARGIAAYERGAFAEALAELDAVLLEVPQHQRARDYRERARLEVLRTPTPWGDGLAAGSAEGLGPAEDSERDAMSAREWGGGTAVATPPALPVKPAPVRVPAATPANGDVTQTVSGRRPRMVLAAVAVAAIATGGVLLFRLPAPSRPAPPAVVTPSTPATTPPLPPVAAPAPGPAAPPASTTTPARPGPAPEPPGPTAKPEPGRKPGGSPGAGGATARRPDTPPDKRPVATPKPSSRVSLTAEETRIVEDTLVLAQMFQARGDGERALREYRRILALDPTHAEALQGVAEVTAAMKSSQSPR